MNNLTIFLNQLKQLDAFIQLVEKFKPFEGQKLSDDQWNNLYRIDSEKAFALLAESIAGVLVQLAQAFPAKEELKGEKGDSIKGDKGEDGPTVSVVVEALRGELLKLASQVQVPEERLTQIKNELQVEVARMVSDIKVPTTEKLVVEKPTIIEKTNVIQQKVQFDLVAALIANKESVRNALEAIEDEEDKLTMEAIQGLPKALVDLGKRIDNIKIDRVDYWGGGLDEGEVLAIVNKALAALSSTNTWEYYAANWSAEPAFNSNITGGAVYDYTLDGVTRYRFVPVPYDPTQDAFYSTFSGGVLSDIIIARG